MTADSGNRTLVEHLLTFTPQSNRTWWCPWFVVLCIGCLIAIVAGILAGSIIGVVYCVFGVGVLCWQVGQRQARPPTCR